MMKLAEAMNTYNIALFMIAQKGYKVTAVLSEDKEEIFSWKAEKQPYEIAAFNPLSLLSLVAISEEYGDAWRTVDHGNLYDAILEKAG